MGNDLVSRERHVSEARADLRNLGPVEGEVDGLPQRDVVPEESTRSVERKVVGNGPVESEELVPVDAVFAREALLQLEGKAGADDVCSLLLDGADVRVEVSA